MGAFYELDRFELSPSQLGTLSAYKTALSLVAPLLVGRFLRAEDGKPQQIGGTEGGVMLASVAMVVMANALEAATGPAAFYTCR